MEKTPILWLRLTKAQRAFPISPMALPKRSTSGSMMLSPAAAPMAMTTRPWVSLHAGPGFRFKGTFSKWASMCRKTRSKWSVAAICQAMSLAMACCCPKRLSSLQPSIIAIFSSTPILIRRKAGKSASGSSLCRAQAGRITTPSSSLAGAVFFHAAPKASPSQKPQWQCWGRG